MATVAERQAERERRRREAEERKKQKERAEQQRPDQVTVVGGDPNFQLGGGTFSILGIVENQALGGAQVISDQVQFRNARDQRQFGGIVDQVVGGQPVQQNNQQAGQQPAGPNVQPNNQQAGAAGVQPGQGGQQPGQEKHAAEGGEPPDLLKRGARLVDEGDIEVEVNLDNKGGKSRHRDFVNFLATDRVPDSIFGIPVVQDESQYTEKDLEFFKKNPKAAGFYDLGDEEVDEDVPQQAVGAGTTYDTQLTKEQEARYQEWRATLPKPLQYEGDYDLRGYWLDPRTAKDGVKDGQHFTDTYKKPNHPTFSVESKYAVGDDAQYAGRWLGDLFDMSPGVVSARAGHKDPQVRENLLREMWKRYVRASGDARGLGEVFYGISGEGALDQDNLPAQTIVNGHRARLVVHANETDRKRSNPANAAFRESFSNLGTLKKDSHVFSKYAWGSGPGTNWYDTAENAPRFKLLAQKEGTTRAALALMDNGARFLNGSLDRSGIPPDAYHYGDGAEGLAPGAVEIPATEVRVGPLPPGFKLGRKGKKQTRKTGGK